MAKTVTLKQSDKIMDKWTLLIQNGQGRSAEIFKMTEKFLTESEVPNMAWEMVEAQPSVIKGFVLSKKRDFLEVTNAGVGESYRMYVGARDVGTYLDVAWFLVEKQIWWKVIARLAILVFTLGAAGTLMGLDFFDEQDLRAYVTITHRCVRQATDVIMGELGQDVSKIDRKSKGSLEVW